MKCPPGRGDEHFIPRKSRRISHQELHTRNVVDDALVLVKFQTAGHSQQVGPRDIRARVRGLRKQTTLIQRKLALFYRYSHQCGVGGVVSSARASNR